MFCYLTSLDVSYVLTDSEPVDMYMVDGQNVPTEAQNFKMNDTKPVVKQVEELQIIIHEVEVNRMNEKADANSIEPNTNMVGESSSKSKSNHKNKGKNGGGSGQKSSKDGKKDYTQQKNNNFKKVYHCWVCGKPRHKAKDCRHKKEYGGENSRGNSNQANHVESPKEFCAIKYICNSKRMFVSYQKVNELEPMFMGNGTASKIEGKGKVLLKLTSRKDLGFKLVFESNKFVITKGGVYVGKGYLDEGLFKLSVVTADNVINNNNAGTRTASVYMIDPSFLWHSRLCWFLRFDDYKTTYEEKKKDEKTRT
ncbi:pol polyprotein [Tanacetum coccineum]